jgi:hypothetical protein
MFTKHVLAGALAAILSCGVAAASDQAESGGDPNELVCTYEKRTGSHIKQKVCVTRSEREQRAREDQDSVQRLKSGGSRPGQGNN